MLLAYMWIRCYWSKCEYDVVDIIEHRMLSVSLWVECYWHKCDSYVIVIIVNQMLLDNNESNVIG